MRRFLYRIPEEDLWELLLDKKTPVEVVAREGDLITFATYEPLEGIEPIREEEVTEDWKSWKESFGPVEVGDLVVLPPWKKVILIKPGMAFGTGLHPSTRLCLRALQDMVREGDSVLDVGTGSGILAVASKVLGARRVLAIDVSEEAVRECRENVRLNRVEVECRRGKPEEIDGTFDLVVANLDISVFQEELKHIVRVSKGRLILSGLYGKEDLRRIEDMLKDQGLLVCRIYEEENWFCVGVGDVRS